MVLNHPETSHLSRRVVGQVKAVLSCTHGKHRPVRAACLRPLLPDVKRSAIHLQTAAPHSLWNRRFLNPGLRGNPPRWCEMLQV